MVTFLSGFFHGFLLGFSLDCSFWRDALANFIPDLIVGGLIAWIITNSQSKKERKIEELKRQKDHIKKTKHILILLKEEVEILNNHLPKVLDEFSETGYGKIIDLSISFWNIIKTKEDITDYLDISLFAKLTAYFESINTAKDFLDKLIDSWIVPDFDLYKIPNVEQVKIGLIEVIKSNIQISLKAKDLVLFELINAVLKLDDQLLEIDKKIKKLE